VLAAEDDVDDVLFDDEPLEVDDVVVVLLDDVLLQPARPRIDTAMTATDKVRTRCMNRLLCGSAGMGWMVVPDFARAEGIGERDR
jgi:hypothetical protein